MDIFRSVTNYLLLGDKLTAKFISRRIRDACEIRDVRTEREKILEYICLIKLPGSQIDYCRRSPRWIIWATNRGIIERFTTCNTELMTMISRIQYQPEFDPHQFLRDNFARCDIKIARDILCDTNAPTINPNVYLHRSEFSNKLFNRLHYSINPCATDDDVSYEAIAVFGPKYITSNANISIQRLCKLGVRLMYVIASYIIRGSREQDILISSLDRGYHFTVADIESLINEFISDIVYEFPINSIPISIVMLRINLLSDRAKQILVQYNDISWEMAKSMCNNISDIIRNPNMPLSEIPEDALQEIIDLG